MRFLSGSRVTCIEFVRLDGRTQHSIKPREEGERMKVKFFDIGLKERRLTLLSDEGELGIKNVSARMKQLEDYYFV